MKRRIAIYALTLLLWSSVPFFGREIGQAQQSNRIEYSAPSWSPDGKRITFAMKKDGNQDIYVIDVDGSHLTRLTDDPATDAFPSWSPNGKKIAFCSKRSGNLEIYVMNADGSHLVRLTSNAGKLNAVPSWSPDGKKIAFVSNRDGRKAQIYVMKKDASNQMRLTDTGAAEFNPEWSPNGKRIVFESNRDNGDIDEIYIMNADGSNQTRITHRTPDGFNNIYPAWLPRVDKISFSSFGGDKIINVYVADPDGSNQTLLIEHATQAQWSRNGKRIAYIQGGKGYPPQIFVMNADGSNRVQLTN